MRVTYKCKKCLGEKQVPKQWQDLQPKFCWNKKCLAPFYKEAELLEVVQPVKQEIKVISKPTKKDKKEEKEE